MNRLKVLMNGFYFHISRSLFFLFNFNRILPLSSKVDYINFFSTKKETAKLLKAHTPKAFSQIFSQQYYTDDHF